MKNNLKMFKRTTHYNFTPLKNLRIKWGNQHLEEIIKDVPVVFRSERIKNQRAANYKADLSSEDDPVTIQERMKICNSLMWKETMNSEMNSLLENNTWIVTDKNAIKTKQLFKLKIVIDF